MTEDQYRGFVDRMDELRRLVRQLRIELMRHRKPLEPPVGEARKQIFTLVANYCSPASGERRGNVSVPDVAAGLWPEGDVAVSMWHRRAIGAALRSLGYHKYREGPPSRQERWRLE